MVAVGSISYGFSILLKPLAAEFDLPRAVVNRGLMAVLIGMAVFGPLIGRALDHVSGRTVVSMGALLFGAGWLVIATAPNVTVALLGAFFLLAPGATALGPVAASTLVSRWFETRRGLAIGVSSIATSTGGLLVVPLLAVLIESSGWRSAVALFGVGSAAVILAMGLLILPSAAPAAGQERSPGDTLKVLPDVAEWRQRDFWLVVLAIGIVFGGNGALLSSLVAYATDRSFSLAQGTALVSLISGVAMLGKLAVGALSDRTDARWLLIGVLALNAMLFGALIAMPGYPLLLAVAVVTGAAVGGATPLWTVIVARRFGLMRMGRVMGLMSAAMLPMNLGALHIVGSVYDATGSYVPAFQLFLAAFVLAGLLILPVRGMRPN